MKMHFYTKYHIKFKYDILAYVYIYIHTYILELYHLFRNLTLTYIVCTF